MTTEEIYHVTWGLAVGMESPVQMEHWLMIRRLQNSNFYGEGRNVVLVMFAISEGESGGALEAWHINVERVTDASGNSLIARFDADGTPDQASGQYMKADSIDLGSFQINEPMKMLLKMDVDAVAAQVQAMFDSHPELAKVDSSLDVAWQKYVAAKKANWKKGFGPWYAYQPGTPRFNQKKRYGAQAMGQEMIQSYVGKVDAQGNPATHYPQLIFAK